MIFSDFLDRTWGRSWMTLSRKAFGSPLSPSRDKAALSESILAPRVSSLREKKLGDLTRSLETPASSRPTPRRRSILSLTLASCRTNSEFTERRIILPIAVPPTWN